MKRLSEEMIKSVNIDAQWIKAASTDMQWFADRLALWEVIAEMGELLGEEERTHARQEAKSLRLHVNCLKKYITATAFAMVALPVKKKAE